MWGFVFAEVCAKKNNEGISSEGRWISCSPYPVQENRQQPNGRGLAARRHPSSHPASYIYRYKARPAVGFTHGERTTARVGGWRNTQETRPCGSVDESWHLAGGDVQVLRQRRGRSDEDKHNDSETAQSWPARGQWPRRPHHPLPPSTCVFFVIVFSGFREGRSSRTRDAAAGRRYARREDAPDGGSVDMQMSDVP